MPTLSGCALLLLPGLSYTTFKYSNIKASSTSISATVQNTGNLTGSEVAQMYLGFPSESGEPPKQLKGFQKVLLAPGGSTTVDFPLDHRSTAIWDASSHGWKPVTGEFAVWPAEGFCAQRLSQGSRIYYKPSDATQRMQLFG
eukprot:COSAG03_NODE_1218_length_4536_cov_15.567275_7_plen_141_part_01